MLSDEDYLEKLEKVIEDLEYKVQCLESDIYDLQDWEDINYDLEQQLNELKYSSIDTNEVAYLIIKSVTSEEIVLENDLKPSETMFWLPGRKLGVTEL